MNKQLMRNQGEAGYGDAPMEQVREILFGAQLKDMEVRFKRQEERFLREIRDAKESFKKRLDSLENFMTSEVNGLLSRLKEEHQEREDSLKVEQRERHEQVKAEQRERFEQIKAEEKERQDQIRAEEKARQDGFNQLSADLAAATETFERRLTKQANTLDQIERELRQLLLGESTSLNEKIESKYSDALSVLNKTAAQIRSDMVYRTSLSTMLTEMVVNLSNPWNAESSPIELHSEEYQDNGGDNGDYDEPPYDGGINHNPEGY